MITVGDRIRLIRKSKNLTQEEFGKPIFLSIASVCLLEQNKIGRIERTIDAICREYNANKEWILFGDGEMYQSTTIDPLLEASIKRNQSLLNTMSFIIPHMSVNDWKRANNFLMKMEG